MSPWIRRALIAGGFGTGLRVPSGITSVVPYSDPPRDHGSPIDDPEAIEIKQPRNASSSLIDDGLVVSVDTPFFHADLESAVRAAEQRGTPVSPTIQKRLVE
jgi:sodium-independent sulfate anion transporter 11